MVKSSERDPGSPPRSVDSEIFDFRNLDWKKFINYVLKFGVFVACVVGCAIQCLTILGLYFQYPTTVFVFVETMQKLDLPGITLCNSNK